MNIRSWTKCKADYSDDDLKGLDCYAGLDLSSTRDIINVCYSFPFETEVRLLTRHYIPEFQLTNVANKNREMYRKWVNQGWIRVTKGDCTDYDQIWNDILKDSEQFNSKMIGFDVWNATQLRTQLQNIRLDVEPFPQTYAR